MYRVRQVFEYNITLRQLTLCSQTADTPAHTTAMGTVSCLRAEEL